MGKGTLLPIPIRTGVILYPLDFASRSKPLGKINLNCKHHSCYFARCGRCKLQNVKVLNNGIDWSYSGNVYWRHDVQRFEVLRIILHGNAEFEATDVVLQVSLNSDFIFPP